MTIMMDWIEIGAVGDIPLRGSRRVATPQGEAAVFRTGSGEIFALMNRCPHRGGPLSEGLVAGKHVACPLHNWLIDLETGHAVAPDERCAPVLPVRVEGGRIWLRLPAARKTAHV
jgi:nitrite reductase (NADH) small subunit